MFRFWRCLVGYNNGPTYGQVLKAYFSGKSKKTPTKTATPFFFSKLTFIFEILSLKEQQLFKRFAIFGTLGRSESRQNKEGSLENTCPQRLFISYNWKMAAIN
ncbi:hypothetical protein BpHYR1_004201 [Brachionus plicatilis]|uniref:Uncharacterized protein n=1 Tax=Brachionus plicatilis TaxID=10195 RepID=A0A3M7R2C3_BRAPC|nr:hypothetical protein BpHYR1_004201 [Brachionus plicatilis]